jgi:hypothetical protein
VACLPAQCAVGLSVKNLKSSAWSLCELAWGLPTEARGGAGERRLAGSTGLEPAASAVTGRRSNQLNYDPKIAITRIGNLVNG